MDPNSILFRLNCPASLSPEQFLSAIEYIERKLPPSDLSYELVPPGRPRRVQDRAEFIRSVCESPDASSAFALYNSTEERIVSFAADYLVHWRTESYWQVRVDQPPAEQSTSPMAPFVLELGDSLVAYNGQATTYQAGTANLQLNRGMGPDFAPPYGLPPLYPPETYVSMAVPFGIEWINYWSHETVETMGFSESEHAGLFHRWERSSSGALVFQVTPEPIELDRPEDIDALNAVYAAFPGIGGRDPKFRIPDDVTEEGA